MIPTIRNALKMATSELNIVTNNIANAGSTGFKRSDGNFLHSYAEDVPIPGKNVGFGVVHEVPRRADNADWVQRRLIFAYTAPSSKGRRGRGTSGSSMACSSS